MAKSMKKALQNFINELHAAAQTNHDQVSADRLAEISELLDQDKIVITDSSRDQRNLLSFLKKAKIELPNNLFRSAKVQQTEADLLNGLEFPEPRNIKRNIK